MSVFTCNHCGENDMLRSSFCLPCRKWLCSSCSTKLSCPATNTKAVQELFGLFIEDVNDPILTVPRAGCAGCAGDSASKFGNYSSSGRFEKKIKKLK